MPVTDIFLATVTVGAAGFAEQSFDVFCPDQAVFVVSFAAFPAGGADTVYPFVQGDVGAVGVVRLQQVGYEVLILFLSFGALIFAGSGSRE